MNGLAASSPLVTLILKQSVSGPGHRKARALSRAFQRLGVRFDAVYLEGPRGMRIDGVTREIRLGSGRPSRSLPAIVSYLRAESPSLALATPAFLAPVAVAAGWLTQTPVIPWESAFLAREVRYLRRRDRLLPILQRLTYPRAPRIAAVSSDVGNELIAACGSLIPPEKLFLLPNPVDADEVRRLSVPLVPRGHRLRLCAVGRLAPEKGYEVLLSALELASPELGEWELVAIGDGELRGELEAQAERLGIRSRVYFVGAVDNPYPHMAASDIFVHAARWDACPNVLCEALSLGLPIVAANAPGGTREILDNGQFGLIVPPSDPKGLAVGIVRLARDEKLRALYAGRAPERAQAFSPDETARRILSLILNDGAAEKRANDSCWTRAEVSHGAE